MTNQVISSNLPLLAAMIPLFGAVSIMFMEENRRVNRITSYIMTFSAIVCMMMVPAALRGDVLGKNYETGLAIMGIIGFRADALSVITAVISSIVWTVATFYGIVYMDGEEHLKRYNVFSLLSLCGMLGVVLTNNLFTLYIFFETLAVASYVMVIHEQTEEAKAAGRIYIFMGVFGGLLLLASIIATYALTGTGNMAEIGYLGRLGHKATPWIVMGFVLGFGAKAGLVPMHIWLPVAHPVAPSHGSALLSGVMVKAGCYGIIRTLYTIVGREYAAHQPYLYIIMLLAGTNIILGSVLAIKQTEIKRMLAYSSISQVGYVIMGACILSPFGLIGSAIHIFHHALIKGTLFLCAGAFIHQTGLRELKDLRGMGKRMPLTMIFFTIGGLSMIGFPPFNGFISKWYLAMGSLLSGTGTGPFAIKAYPEPLGIILMIVFFISSFLNLLYYGPIIYNAWFEPIPSSEELTEVHPHGGHGFRKLVFQSNGEVRNDDPIPSMIIPIGVLGVGILLTGMLPFLFPGLGLAKRMVEFYFAASVTGL